jgi:hypothetical protein
MFSCKTLNRFFFGSLRNASITNRLGPIASLHLALFFLPLITRADDEPKITEAPSGQYKIVQRTGKDGGVDENNVLRFRDKSKPAVILKAPTALDVWGPHSRGVVNLGIGANYFISPDEQWIIRDQKVGAGCNVLILYRVEQNGRVQRFVLNLPAFHCIGLAPDHYGHLGVQFVSWDMPSGLVHLEVGANQGFRGSAKQQAIPDAKAYPDIDGSVTYDVKNHRMINDNPNRKPAS